MNYRYISRLDSEYPQRLQNIPDPPSGIYVSGVLPPNNVKTVAIVGSRACSEYGKCMAKEFALELAKAGVVIVSGLARGIDGIAQEAAVRSGGISVGVLGCGIDVVYPASNARVYDLVCQKGGIISEYPPGRPAIAGQFPARNRIISGLADAVLVVEAKRRSGTSITVNRALEQGKDVYAIPGRIYDECSRGCNELIASGAYIALSPDVILDGLGIKTKAEEKADIDNAVISSLTEDEVKVLKCLEYQPVDVESLFEKTKLPLQDLYVILLNLQLKGLCKEVATNQYCRVK